jgi:hypothetical protein
MRDKQPATNEYSNAIVHVVLHDPMTFCDISTFKT